MKTNFLTGFFVLGMTLILMFAGCTPMEGTLEDMRQKAIEENQKGGGDTYYTVYFESNYGSTVASQSIKAGETASLPPNPMRAGWTFVNWYGDSELNSEYVFSSPVNSTITLYAKWKANILSIGYANGGGTGADPASPASANYGTSITMPVNPYERDGFNFAGWQVTGTGAIAGTYAAGANVSVADLSSAIANGDAGITLTAAWLSKDGITVSFDRQGGNGISNSIAVKFGDPYGTLPSGITRPGYAFNGWRTAPAGGGSVVTGATTVANSSDHTLYAAWSPYTLSITYASGTGGSGSAPTAPASADYGTDVIMPANTYTPPASHVFGGWDVSGAGSIAGTYKEGASVPVENLSTAIDNGNASIRLTPVWTPVYTVAFNTDGGNAAPEPQPVVSGDKAAKPPTDPTKTLDAIPDSYNAGLYRYDQVFLGWYNGSAEWNFNNAVTDNITLTAKWGPPPVISVAGQSGANIVAQAVSYVKANIGAYTLLLDNSYTVVPQTLSGSGLSLALKGKGGEQTLTLSGNGSIFTAENGAKLVLENNIKLQGHASNNSVLVAVSDGGALEMKSGSVITGNTWIDNAGKPGGGVYVGGAGSTFTMDGGTISGNKATNQDWYRYGAGVYVYTGGTFTMNGGSISGNEITTTGHGGGVYFGGTTFTMNGGTISGNTAANEGGGVWFSGSGTFTMNGGEISGNTAKLAGGVYCYGTFTMSGTAKISANKSNGDSYSGYGGGVYCYGAFTMSGGEISGNTASARGGGVFCSIEFTMSGGAIFGNNADNEYGGGVYLGFNTTFKKTSAGGTINGYTSGDNTSNVVGGSLVAPPSYRGHAIYVQPWVVADPGLRRDNNVAAGETLEYSWNSATSTSITSGTWQK